MESSIIRENSREERSRVSLVSEGAEEDIVNFLSSAEGQILVGVVGRDSIPVLLLYLLVPYEFPRFGPTESIRQSNLHSSSAR